MVINLMTKVKNVLFAVYKLLFSWMGKTLPKNKQLVIFESFLGKQYSDSPRAIYEYLAEHYPEYELYWSVEKKAITKFEELNIPFVRRFSLKWMFLMNRAKFWVSNSRLPLWIPKPPKTTYVQTWHGTPLKKLAVDMEEVHMPGTNTEQYKRNFVTETKKWDYLISPNAYSTEIFKRAFQFERELIESGYPRNDYLINHNTVSEINKIKTKLGIPFEKKVILYAPTWRDNQFYGRGRYKFDIAMDLEQMQEKLSDEYVVLLRMHYLIAEDLNITAYSNFVYDLSFHEDIRELYLISDILITDYSSVFFDFANLKRPMIFYVYDIEEYRDTLRGFYFDFEREAPGPLVKTTSELIQAVKKLKEQGNVAPESNEFYQRFCYLENGLASQKVVERIFNADH